MRTVNVSDMTVIKGGRVFDRPDGGPQRFELWYVTEGCSILILDNEGRECLVANTVGEGHCAFSVTGEFSLVVEGDTEGSRTSILLPWQREDPEVGWEHGESFAQVELKGADDVPVQVRAMFEKMQQNSRMRELQLQDQINQLRASRAIPSKT